MKALTPYCCLAVLSLLCVGTFPVAQAYDLKDNAIWHVQQGSLLMERERYDEAAEEFRAALRLNPYAAMASSAYNDLGLAYRYQGKYELAMASFQRAIRMQPNYELYYKNLIDTYTQAGRLPAAQSALKRILSYNSADAEAWFLLGEAYEAVEDKNTARECFSNYLQLEPDAPLANAARHYL